MVKHFKYLVEFSIELKLTLLDRFSSVKYLRKYLFDLKGMSHSCQMINQHNELRSLR